MAMPKGYSTIGSTLKCQLKATVRSNVNHTMIPEYSQIQSIDMKSVTGYKFSRLPSFFLIGFGIEIHYKCVNGTKMMYTIFRRTECGQAILFSPL